MLALKLKRDATQACVWVRTRS